MSLNYDYTINSTDPEHYNRIYANTSGGSTREANLTVTSLTTNCNIVVLNDTDYITVNQQTFVFTDNYTSMDVDTFVGLINTLIGDNLDITFAYDTCNRIKATSDTLTVRIQDASYNVKLLMGLTNTTLPLESSEISSVNNTEGSSDNTLVNTLQISEVGAFLSTPVLYLASNIGYNSYKNISDSGYLTSMRIVMRLNNSYSAAYPIFATNGDFIVKVLSTDLSDMRFTLVDANYVEVQLLNPMYITISVEPIEDNTEEPLFNQETSNS